MAKLARFVTLFTRIKPPLVAPKKSVLPVASQISLIRHFSTVLASTTSQKHIAKQSQQCVLPLRFMSAEPSELVEIEDRVLYVLRLYDKIEQDKLSLGAHFMRDMGLDSLDHVEIIIAMEDEFGHYIPDIDAEKLLTPQEIVDYIADKLDVFE